MKFVHIADMHFDRPFLNLADAELFGDLKRLEQRKVFKKIIEYVKENKIDILFIAGDLYEHKYIKLSTIEYINNLFKEIPETKIFISPGNHDPYLKKSYYNQYYWNKNVKIFNSKLEKVDIGEAVIYGFGFDDFYCTNSEIEKLEIENRNKINILEIHGTLNGSSLEEKQYNSLNEKELKEKGFDYIALGHIHKTNFEKDKNILYPGSTISLGFDELGKHGMIVGNIEKNNLKLEFIPLDESFFVEKEIDVTKIISKEELIEKINEININENEYAKIILVGKRKIEINTYNLYKLIVNDRIIKIKNKSLIDYNLEEMANEKTLKGLFAKKMSESLKDENLTNEEKEKIEKAIEIGLEALE